jgi:hypothetical protein
MSLSSVLLEAPLVTSDRSGGDGLLMLAMREKAMRYGRRLPRHRWISLLPSSSNRPKLKSQPVRATGSSPDGRERPAASAPGSCPSSGGLCRPRAAYRSYTEDPLSATCHRSWSAAPRRFKFIPARLKRQEVENIAAAGGGGAVTRATGGRGGRWARRRAGRGGVDRDLAAMKWPIVQRRPTIWCLSVHASPRAFAAH